MSSKLRLLSACTATLLASGLLHSQSAHANLFIDLRTPTGTKSADISPSGVINLDVFAKVTLTTGNAETQAAFQELQGSFISAPGAPNLLGTIAAAGFTPAFPPGSVTQVGLTPFTDTGSVPGNSTDLDTDTDLDLGHANADVAAGFTYIRDDRPNKASTQGAGYVGVVLDANNVEWKIGRISFTADAAAAAGQTTNVNFAFRRDSTGAIAESSALWFEPATKTGTSGVVAVGAPVVLTLVPGGPPQWNVNADGSWAAVGSWQGGIPNSNTAIANFLGKITAPHTVSLDGSKQVLEVHFNNANKYTIAPGSGGTLTIGNGTTGLIETVQGTHEISAAVALSGAVNKTGPGTLRLSGAQSHAAGSSLNVSAGTVTLASDAGTAAGASAAVANLSLAINGDGAKVVLESNQNLKGLTINTAATGTQGLDLASPANPAAANILRVYAAPADLANTKAALNAAVINARTNANDGIYDSNLHANMAIGVATVADAHGDSAVTVRATRLGDLNLDGSTTIADFIALASHFNQPGLWQDGDINYDGSVTIADFIALASNFNQSYTGETWAISAQDEKLLSSFAASVGAVPEPGIMGSFLIGAFGLLLRRRRRGS